MRQSAAYPCSIRLSRWRRLAYASRLVRRLGAFGGKWLANVQRSAILEIPLESQSMSFSAYLPDSK